MINKTPPSPLSGRLLYSDKLLHQLHHALPNFSTYPLRLVRSLANGSVLELFQYLTRLIPLCKIIVLFLSYWLWANFLNSTFTSNRSRVVAVGGELSTIKGVVSGVLQGSVLGPLLFIGLHRCGKPNIRIQLDLWHCCLAASIHPQATRYCKETLLLLWPSLKKRNIWSSMKTSVLMLISRKHSHSNATPLFIKSNTALEQVDTLSI